MNFAGAVRSRVVSDYLDKCRFAAASGIARFSSSRTLLVAQPACGNSGPLDADYEKALNDNNIVGVSVLSGNRNFEARVHQSIRANFLMSPPLVVAFALAAHDSY